MPTVQSKILNDALNQEKSDKKIMNYKDSRNATSSNMQQVSRVKKNKANPDLDLKTVSPRIPIMEKHSNKKDKNTKKAKNVSCPSNKVNKNRLSAREHPKCKTNTYSSDFLSVSGSSFYLTPRQDVLENDPVVLNANAAQLSCQYYECDESDNFFRTQYPDFENSTELDYQTATGLEDLKLSPMEPIGLPNSRMLHSKHFLSYEGKNSNLLGKSEIDMLKDILKADERFQELRRDDHTLLKEILLGQLEEISQQEHVIKSALNKIRSKGEDTVEVSSLKVNTPEQPMEEYSSTPKIKEPVSARCCPVSKKLNSSSKQEVEVVFKNVPSLENEIRILRSLGMKLEETLKHSEPKKDEETKNLVLNSIQEIYFLHFVCIPSLIVTPKGLQIITDKLQEFQIRYQTMKELQLEKEFYIPVDINKFTLERTDFEKLRHNPDLLLRRLKPLNKDSRLKFNIIEQDPTFFNHFLSRMCSISSDCVENYSTFIPKKIEERRSNFKNDLRLIKSDTGDHFNTLLQNKSISAEQPTLKLPNVTKKLKKQKQHCGTPLAKKKLEAGKCSRIRAILLGTLQISVILIIISAFLYPEIICD